MRRKLYFGHPINVYGTELEKRLLDRITGAFPEWDIENPNQPSHEAGYQTWKKERGNGMEYYFQVVLPACGGGIFLPFRDGKWGAGVFGEAQAIARQGGPVWEITHRGIISTVELREVRVLSVEDTRSRIRTPTGDPKSY